MPCPYGWRAVRLHPLRLCPAWGHGMPCPYSPWWMHGTAVPRRVARCASTSLRPLRPLRPLRERPLRPFVLRGGTAPPCPYSPWWMHGTAVPRRMTFCASTSLRPLPPLRPLRERPLPPSVLRGGTAPPCPYSPWWMHGTAVPRRMTFCASTSLRPLPPLRPLREHPLRPFVLRGARHRRAPTALGGCTAPPCPDG
ncbi:MAG: hypothetical protein KatS3mg055_0876 [Chloroflexus sp.]|nr:MAG: hypothetical protein KatS3mg055_0876 [Chloroflexus sp.]